MGLSGARIESSHDVCRDLGVPGVEHGGNAQVSQCLVRVVPEEALDFIHPANLRVQQFNPLNLAVVQAHERGDNILVGQVVLVLPELLELGSDVEAVDPFVPEDQADDIRRVRQFTLRSHSQRGVEPGVEQERLGEHAGGVLARRRSITVLALEGRSGSLEQGLRCCPPEQLINLLGRAQGREDRGVTLSVNVLHERDVRQDSLLVRGLCVLHKRRHSHAALESVQQGQGCEHLADQFPLILRHLAPTLEVVAHRNLLREPEVSGQSIPDRLVQAIFDTVPVNGFVGHLFSLEIVCTTLGSVCSNSTMRTSVTPSTRTLRSA